MVVLWLALVDPAVEVREVAVQVHVVPVVTAQQVVLRALHTPEYNH